MCVNIYTCVNGALGALPAPGCTCTSCTQTHQISWNIANDCKVDIALNVTIIKIIWKPFVSYRNLMPILAATPAIATLHLYIHGESSRNCQNSNFRVAISESIQREAKFCIFFRGTSPNHRFAKGRRTQIDAPQHHPQSGPKLAVQCEIHEFL